MANEVGPMQSIADKVKERIKSQFADLIPDEVYNTLVQTALHEFTTRELPGIVKEEAKKHLLELVKIELAKPEWWQTQYLPNGQALASELIGKLLREHSADIVAGMMGGVVMNMVNYMRNNRMI